MVVLWMPIFIILVCTLDFGRWVNGQILLYHVILIAPIQLC